MVSVKRQIQSLESAYQQGTLNRSSVDQVSDKAIRKILQEALRPWYQGNVVLPAVALGALSIPIYYWTKNWYITAGVPGGLYIFWLVWSWLSHEEKKSLGIVFALWQIDEDRIKKILQKLDIDQHKLTKSLTLSARQAMLQRVKLLKQDMTALERRATQLPELLEQDEAFLRAGIKGMGTA